MIVHCDVDCTYQKDGYCQIECPYQPNGCVHCVYVMKRSDYESGDCINPQEPQSPGEYFSRR